MEKMFNLRRDLALFWVSCFMLFFEILMIRWLSAEIRIFSYFHNLVLLFCFLGIGLGCALSKKRIHFLIPFVIMTSFVLMLARGQYLGHSLLRNMSQYLSLGLNFLIWYRPGQAALHTKMLMLVAGTGMFLFTVSLLTFFFVPFGQILGRLLNEYKHPLRAYGINLFGSLVGIWLFNVISFFSLPPLVWLALGGLCCLVFLSKRKWQVSVAILLLILSLFFLFEKRTASKWTIWSPYQKLTILPATVPVDNQKVQYGHIILVNSVGYMQISNYSPAFMAQYPLMFPADEIPYDHYNIPYRFTGRLDNVLLVGAGAGNDAAGALRNGAKRVTAVDIDPGIIEIGRLLHPERPYSDSQVRVVIDDARSFFKKTEEKYDLIVFGLLDSHTLSSSYSNVRLDNYVYTLDSFLEAKHLLKPHGVLVLIFEVQASDEFIGARIQKMLAKAFTQQPISFLVRSDFRGWGGTGFVVGDQGVINEHLEQDTRLRKIVGKSKVDSERWATSSINLATDDWPYLYLPSRNIPNLYFLIFGLLIFISYLGIKKSFGQRQNIDWHFFFLGAGFLLLEVQNISKLALLFGTTWTVNSIVISAILIMILLANYFVMKMRITSLKPYYIALFITLLVNFALPLGIFAGMPTVTKGLLAGAIMVLPIFFAGIIFSTSFSRSEDRANVFASNLFGAMVGGMMECLSFIVGIKALLIVAFVLYLLSMISRRQISQSTSSGMNT
jgi:spermidine synthase